MSSIKEQVIAQKKGQYSEMINRKQWQPTCLKVRSECRNAIISSKI